MSRNLERPTRSGYSDAIVTEHLRPGETVQWIGHPDPAAFAKIPRLWAQTAFGSVYALFALSFLATAAGDGILSSGPGLLFFLVPLLFIAMGLYASSAILRLAARARRTTYAITDQRVLILERNRSALVASTIAPSEISELETRRSADGRGTIRLRDSASKSVFSRSFDLVKYDDSLWGVADVAGASAAIDALRTQRAPNA